MIFHEKVLNIQCYSSMNVNKDRHVAKGENMSIFDTLHHPT